MALPPDLATRVQTARDDRRRHQRAINDFLRLADPTAPRLGDTLSRQTERIDEADDLFDPNLQEVTEDFSSELLHRLMPRERNWLEYEPEQTLAPEFQRQLEGPLKARTAAIFAEIRRSTFYDEAAADWAFDLAHGTGAMIVSDYAASEPICCEAIGPDQLLIDRGAKGRLGFKAREQVLPLEDAFATWPDLSWPAKLRRRVEAKGSRRDPVRVLEAATRVYDPADEKWRWRIAVDDEVIFDETFSGRGSCPIIVTRWRSRRYTAWGLGPLRKSVPDAKALDQLRYLQLKNLGNVVDPPTVYDDDGVLNPEGGVGPGMWMPRLPGSKVEQLTPEGRMDLAYFEMAGLQDAIRRAGYQAGPRQRGKTPPTAAQWFDEKAEEGRRLEQPTGKLYAEGVVAICERFEWLLMARGAIDPILRVGDRDVRVRPMNALAREQEGDKVSTANNLLNAWRASFDPQIVASSVDTVATMENMKRAVGDELIVLRAPEQADPLLRGVLGQPGMGPGLEGPVPEAAA